MKKLGINRKKMSIKNEKLFCMRTFEQYCKSTTTAQNALIIKLYM